MTDITPTGKLRTENLDRRVSAMHDELKELRSWRVKMLVSLLGSGVAGAIAVGGVFYQVRANTKAIEKEDVKIESVKDTQSGIKTDVEVTKTKVEAIEKTLERQGRILDRIDRNTSSGPR